MMHIYKVFSDFLNVSGACDAASEYCSSLSAHHSSDTVTFYDSNGKLEAERTMSYVPDVKTTLETVGAIRHCHKYRIVLGSDSGMGKTLVTAALVKLDEKGDVVFGDGKNGTTENIILLALVDEILESYENLEIIFRKLGFPYEFSDLKFSCDLKLCLTVLGLMGAQSTHSCPYGHCYRYRLKDGKEEKNTRGRWRKEGIRTLANCRENHHNWLVDGEANPKKLQDFMGCKKPPIPIFGEEFDHVPLISLFPPMPLHILLGKLIIFIFLFFY